MTHKIPPHQHDDDLLYQIASGAESVLLYRNLRIRKKRPWKSFSLKGFGALLSIDSETGGEAALDFVADRLPPLHEEGEVFGEAELKSSFES